MTSKGGQSRKRRGRPGAAAAPPKPSARTARPPAAEGSAVEPEQVAARPAVKPDRDPGLQPWTVPAWLMMASASWSVIVAWQLIRATDDTGFAAEGPPWLLILAALTAAVASATAFWRLRSNPTANVRLALIIAGAAGVFAVFSSLMALAALVLVRRAKR